MALGTWDNRSNGTPEISTQDSKWHSLFYQCKLTRVNTSYNFPVRSLIVHSSHNSFCSQRTTVFDSFLSTTMATLSIPPRLLLQNAARIYCCVPDLSFSTPMALVCTGASLEEATNSRNIKYVNDLIAAYKNEIKCTNEIENIKERSMIIWSVASVLPSLSKTKGVSDYITKLASIQSQCRKMQSDVLRLTGLDDNRCEWNAAKQYLHRFASKLEKGSTGPVTRTSLSLVRPHGKDHLLPSRHAHCHPRSSSSTNFTFQEFASADSDCHSEHPRRESGGSAISDITSGGSAISDITEYTRPTSSSTHSTCSTRSTLSSRPGSSLSCGSRSFSSLTTKQSNRLTSQAKHAQRQDEANWKDTYATAHILLLSQRELRLRTARLGQAMVLIVPCA